MVATLTSVYRGEETLPMQEICARYCGCIARACWGQNNRSIAERAKYFCGEARAIGTFSGKYQAVRCRTKAFWSPVTISMRDKRVWNRVEEDQESTLSSCLAMWPAW